MDRIWGNPMPFKVTRLPVAQDGVHDLHRSDIAGHPNTLYLLPDNIPDSQLPRDQLEKGATAGLAKEMRPIIMGHGADGKPIYDINVVGIPTLSYVERKQGDTRKLTEIDPDNPDAPRYVALTEQDIKDAFANIYRLAGANSKPGSQFNEIVIPVNPITLKPAFGGDIARRANQLPPEEFDRLMKVIEDEFMNLEKFLTNDVQDPKSLPPQFQEAYQAGIDHGWQEPGTKAASKTAEIAVPKVGLGKAAPAAPTIEIVPDEGPRLEITREALSPEARNKSRNESDVDFFKAFDAVFLPDQWAHQDHEGKRTYTSNENSDAKVTIQRTPNGASFTSTVAGTNKMLEAAVACAAKFGPSAQFKLTANSEKQALEMIQKIQASGGNVNAITAIRCSKKPEGMEDMSDQDFAKILIAKSQGKEAKETPVADKPMRHAPELPVDAKGPKAAAPAEGQPAPGPKGDGAEDAPAVAAPPPGKAGDGAGGVDEDLQGGDKDVEKGAAELAAKLQARRKAKAATGQETSKPATAAAAPPPPLLKTAPQDKPAGFPKEMIGLDAATKAKKAERDAKAGLAAIPVVDQAAATTAKPADGAAKIHRPK